MKNYFYKVLLSITILVITGCSGTLYLIDKNNKKDTVTYNSLDKSMEVIHNGVLYKGSYVTNSSVGYGSVQNFGNKPSYGTTQIFTSGNSGRSILYSDNNDKLSCEFNYQYKNVIGVCSDSKGEKFDLISEDNLKK
jgi:hypothetical protein